MDRKTWTFGCTGRGLCMASEVQKSKHRCGKMGKRKCNPYQVSVLGFFILTLNLSVFFISCFQLILFLLSAKKILVEIKDFEARQGEFKDRSDK